MATETHALWSGVLTFGLVSMPVSVVSALKARRQPFHLLHKSDHARLARKMLCPKDNKFVEPEHFLRGYEVAPDRYVVIRDKDIQAIEPERSRNIEIQEFVDAGQIEPIYYDRPYYLVPQKGAEKPYSLLVDTLAKTDKVGIAEFIMHAQEHLVALRAIDGVLCLLRLHFQETVEKGEDLAPSVEAKDAETKKIRAAIEKMTMEFDPRQFHDEYQDQIAKMIERKKKKHQTVEVPQTEEAPEEAATGEEGGDLIAALEESLARAKATGPAKKGRKRGKAA